jgi:hypothetical protein
MFTLNDLTLNFGGDTVYCFYKAAIQPCTSMLVIGTPQGWRSVFRSVFINLSVSRCLNSVFGYFISYKLNYLAALNSPIHVNTIL